MHAPSSFNPTRLSYTRKVAINTWQTLAKQQRQLWTLQRSTPHRDRKHQHKAQKTSPKSHSKAQLKSKTTAAAAGWFSQNQANQPEISVNNPYTGYAKSALTLISTISPEPPIWQTKDSFP
jgi:hypothetical protein